MRKWTKKEDAVSPVIAVILMVAITVVLAAVLYVTVQNIANQQTEGLEAMSMTYSKANSTGYVVSIAKGSVLYADATVRVLYANGSSNPNVQIQFNDLDADNNINGGDNFNIWSGTSSNLKDQKFQIVKSGQVVSELTFRD